jgi:hypothetical protein
MRTTIEIRDPLLAAVNRMAAEAVLQTALRRHLQAAAVQAEARPRLRRHGFRRCGLRPGLSESDWAAIRERAYDGRGG